MLLCLRSESRVTSRLNAPVASITCCGVNPLRPISLIATNRFCFCASSALYTAPKPPTPTWLRMRYLFSSRSPALRCTTIASAGMPTGSGARGTVILKDAAQRQQDAATDGLMVPQLLQMRCAAGAIYSSFLAIIFIYLKYSRYRRIKKWVLLLYTQDR